MNLARTVFFIVESVKPLVLDETYQEVVSKLSQKGWKCIDNRVFKHSEHPEHRMVVSSHHLIHYYKGTPTNGVPHAHASELLKMRLK
jgi:hypothetical protein